MSEGKEPNFFEYLKQAREEHIKLLEIHPELEALSARELEVFAYLLTDKTLSDISKELFVTYSSVHFHCKNIYRKLQISNRKQLLIKYKDL